jgi:YVTN family beta-propeller protein
MVPHPVRRWILFLFLVFALARTVQGQSQVYVLDEGTQPLVCSSQPCYGPTLHLINSTTGHDLARIQTAPTGQRGTSVRASSDGQLLFVTSVPYNAPSQAGQLLVVDPIAKTTIATIPVGAGPTDVAVLPDNSRAYVVNGSDDTVSVVDLSTFTVVKTIAVGSGPLSIVAAVNGSAVYVTNRGSASVTKISTINNLIAATIGVGSVPGRIDISPDGSRLFVANAGSFTVSVIDANLDSVLRNLPAGTSTNPPIDVAALSATRVEVLLHTQLSITGEVTSPGSALLLDAGTGAVLGSFSERALVLTSDSSGSPAYAITPGSLDRIAANGSSATMVSPTLANLVEGTVITDPCAFEASASATVLGGSGGSGTLTIPAPAGCAWTINPSGFTGLSVASPLSGTGPATRTFTVASTTVPHLGGLDIGRQRIAFEQTVPRMNVEFASTAVQQEPLTIGGWAFDENAFSDGTASADTGVAAIHVWAYPAGGAAPIFVGAANYGVNRPDIAAAYGAKYALSGFQIGVGNLPSGAYTLVFYALSTRSGTFSNAQALNVTVQQAPARIVIDSPSSQVANLTPLQVSGWAIDPAGSAAGGGSGVDAVQVYAYPESGGAPIFLGAAQTGIARPDVAAFLGSAFTQSGFALPSVSLAPGAYTLVVYARSTATRQFFAQTQRMTIRASLPQMNVDSPAASLLSRPFSIVGWAIDQSSSTGTGVDVVQAWAYPVNGATPIFVGTATAAPRPDVAAYVGSRFLNCGFQINGASLPAGTYDLVVFARSTVTQTFNNTKVVRITVQ